MNIRSIIGLTALTPYIVGSALLISTACAPKSRYRAPVNLGGVAGKPVNPKDKAQQLDLLNSKNSTNELRKKAEQLNQDISDLDVVSDDDKTTVNIKKKEKDGKESNITATGSSANENNASSRLESNNDLQITENCLSSDDGKVDCTQKRIDVVRDGATVSFLVSKGINAAIVETIKKAEKNELDQALENKLNQVRNIEVTLIENLNLKIKNTLKKQKTLIAVINQEEKDQNGETIGALQMTLKANTDEQGKFGKLEITENNGLEGIASAEVVEVLGQRDLSIKICGAELESILKIGSQAANLIAASNSTSTTLGESIKKMDQLPAANPNDNIEYDESVIGRPPEEKKMDQLPAANPNDNTEYDESVIGQPPQ